LLFAYSEDIESGLLELIFPLDNRRSEYDIRPQLIGYLGGEAGTGINGSRSVVEISRKKGVARALWKHWHLPVPVFVRTYYHGAIKKSLSVPIYISLFTSPQFVLANPSLQAENRTHVPSVSHPILSCILGRILLACFC
jgi:hypothetical protein